MRHLLILAAVAAFLAAIYFWAQSGTVVVNGRVLLQHMDGRELAISGAKLAWQPSEGVEQQLLAWLEAREKWQGDNELRVRAARNEWNQRVALREEAARILRVAERANAVDLEICRARHREASADAEDALRSLENLLAGADEAADPARFLASLPAPSVEFAADGDGRFTMHAPSAAGYIVASLERVGDRKEFLLWLRAVQPGENELVQFSNANVLTSESLSRLAGEIKNRGAFDGSPLESSAK